MRKFLITRMESEESAESRTIPRGLVSGFDTYEEAVQNIATLREDREYQIFEAVCNFVVQKTVERVKMPIM